MNRITKTAFLLLIIITIADTAKAQDKDFWFVAPDFAYGKISEILDRPVYFNITAGQEPAVVTMTMPAYTGNTAKRVITLAPYESKQIKFNSAAEIDSIENTILVAGITGVKHNRGIHFSSTAPVYIYYALTAQNSRTILTLKGHRALGTAFYVPNQTVYNTGASYGYAYNQFHVVASEDNTSVTITPTAAWYGGPSGTSQTANVPYTVTLQRGETVAIRSFTQSSSSPRFSGSKVTATKPVSVVVNEDLVTSGTGTDAAADQLVPISNLGKDYVVVRGYAGASYGDRLYILATDETTPTTVTVTPYSGAPVTTTITAGNAYVYHLSSETNYTATISADKPVYVWQQSGVGNLEIDCVLIPSMYAINGRNVSFYKEETGTHYICVLVRVGNESMFKVNNSSTVLTASDFSPIPNMAGWKFARKNITSLVLSGTPGTVRVNNPSGPFSLGYFQAPGGSAMFGYISSFGDFEFPEDTVYKCSGSTYTLDGGFALSYLWTLPDGTTATTPTLNALQTGKYKLTVNQDPHLVKDSIWVLDRYDGTKIVSSPTNILDMGAGTRNYSVDFAEQTNANTSYQWFINGVTIPAPMGIAATLTHTWVWGEEGDITVQLIDSEIGCNNSFKYHHYAFPDNVVNSDCYTTPPPTIWDIERKMVSDVEIHNLATPFTGDLDGDGHIEVVVPSNIGYPSTAKDMLIFNDQLQLIRTITPPVVMPEYNTMTNLIADVDNDGKGEIVIATIDSTLICYSHLGAEKWTSNAKFSNPNPNNCPSLIVGDINSDGHCEILVVDKLFDGETGHLVASLPFQFGTLGYGYSSGGPQSFMPVFADIDNDGIQEIVAGNTVYKISSINRSIPNNPVKVMSKITTIDNGITAPDGFTAVADIDLDGDLDVIVTGGHPTGNYPLCYVWDGATETQIGNTMMFSTASGRRISRPFAGDITGNGHPDIALTYTNNITAYTYNAVSNMFDTLWLKPTTDASGATTMSMFDFNMDGEVELVYRDMTHIRIINKNGNDTASFGCGSATHTEYPIVVDLDRDGHADILVSGNIGSYSGTRLVRYGSITSGAWAAARTVWNQHAYNATNINEDLTVPRYPVNNATVLPGSADGIIGDGNDIRPYNNFLQQQTPLSVEGRPVWTLPDAVYNISSQPTAVRDGDSICVTVCIDNIGDAPLGKPIYLSFYRDSISAVSRIKTDSINDYIQVGKDSCFVTYIKALPLKFADVVIRLNDRFGVYPYQAECHHGDSVRVRLNPALSLYVRKKASIGDVPGNGHYQNPVAVLYNENIKYEISAFNANTHDGATFIIRDTLPAYLDTTGIATLNLTPPPDVVAVTPVPGNPPRSAIRFEFHTEPKLSTRTITFNATPVSGAVASQPLFVNYAVAETDNYDRDTDLPSGSLSYRSDTATYHQGAGIAIVTFSASVGGIIFGNESQAVDYRTTARSGVVVVPNDGYRFIGWAHDSYISLRGDAVLAATGIMSYDTLTIYGNVELRAEFVPDTRTDNAVETLHATSLQQQPVIWAHGGKLFVKVNELTRLQGNELTRKQGNILRIYTPDGILYKQQTILNEGITTIKLPSGIYICTLNNGIGTKIVIN
jgi:hypothetical protein